MKRLATLTFLCIAFFWATPAVGELYYWTDDNGIRHYSNEAPPTGDIDYGSSSEIEYDAQADMERRASDTRAAGEMEKARKAEAAEAAQKEAEAEKAATEEERERLEAEKRAIEEDLYKKRRATHGSRMQKGIQRVVEVDKQIEELENSGGSAEEIELLKARRRQLVEEFYRKSRYWKRGGQADLKEHKEIQEQLDALEKKE
jgi:hypothetical protein